MSVAPLAAARPKQPYPGLRPFEAYEWPIFFGRERMIDEVIDRLARDSLVVIRSDAFDEDAQNPGIGARPLPRKV